MTNDNAAVTAAHPEAPNPTDYETLKTRMETRMATDHLPDRRVGEMIRDAYDAGTYQAVMEPRHSADVLPAVDVTRTARQTTHRVDTPLPVPGRKECRVEAEQVADRILPADAPDAARKPVVAKVAALLDDAHRSDDEITAHV